MINVVFLGYRDWAIQIFQDIGNHNNINLVDTILSQDEFEEKASSFSENIDILLFVGWSWIIPKVITEKYLCLGIHPSDLPSYRGGSPLQHQIIAGLKNTKVSLMTLSSVKLDGGAIWLKEELDLSGCNMNVIFDNLKESSVRMLNDFFNRYPHITPVEQDILQGSYFKRRTGIQSRLSIDQLSTMSLEEIYNFIRALTDPYPNAYIEDKWGNKLYFTGVKYVESETPTNNKVV